MSLHLTCRCGWSERFTEHDCPACLGQFPHGALVADLAESAAEKIAAAHNRFGAGPLRDIEVHRVKARLQANVAAALARPPPREPVDHGLCAEIAADISETMAPEPLALVVEFGEWVTTGRLLDNPCDAGATRATVDCLEEVWGPLVGLVVANASMPFMPRRVVVDGIVYVVVATTVEGLAADVLVTTFLIVRVVE